uniref:FBA_2 domain-containing protein n=1 Tax=Caenorhabditis tropicalis TaxID=1561998 RepID=A0A1I7UVX7_9PELO
MPNIPVFCFPVLKANKTTPSSNPVETVMIGGHRVPVKIETDKNGEEYLETYWDDENLGLTMIADYVCDLYRFDLFSILLLKEDLELFHWLHNRQSFMNVSENHQISNGGYNTSSSDSEFLEIDSNVRENIGIGNFNRELELVRFFNCPWITIEDLMTVDARRIKVVAGKLFTNQDVNRFLKHWMRGGSPRLKQIKIDVESEWNEEAFLEGINVQKAIPGERFYKG